jgi:hypothetical protein
MAESQMSIWDKVNYDLSDVTDDTDTTTSTPSFQTGEWWQRWKRIRPVLDIAGTLFWLYVILKVFVIDVDRKFLEWVAPGADWLVDYRVFFFLGLIAVVLIVARTRGALVAGAYIAGFPLVVLFVKVPKLLIKTRSWVTFFAVANVISSFFSSLRYAVVAGTVFAFSALFILATDSSATLIPPVIGLLCVLAVSFVRTFRFSAKVSRFLQVQESTIDRAVKSDGIGGLTKVSDELRSAEIQVFNAEQQQKFVQALSSSVLMHRLLYFWAYELEKYRQSPVSLAFNMFGYVWLFLQTVATLTLINYAIYKIDPHAYSYVDPPSVLTFARYVLASFGGGEIQAVQAQSNLASVLSIGSTLIGIIFLVGLGITLFITIRQGRQDDAVRSTITRIKEQGTYLEKRLESEYELSSVEEAVRRLRELRSALLGIITYISSRIPTDFERQR